MTCFDKYVSEQTLPVVGCPHHYNYLPQPTDCYSMSCFAHCWSREIPEEKEEK